MTVTDDVVGGIVICRRCGPSLSQRLSLPDAEAMLFVDDDEAEVLEGNGFLDQGMRAENNGDRAFGDFGLKFFLGRFGFKIIGIEDRGARAGHDADRRAILMRHFLHQFSHGGKMLLDEDLRRRHECGLDARTHFENRPAGFGRNFWARALIFPRRIPGSFEGKIMALVRK